MPFTHLRRAIEWNVADVKPTSDEREGLREAGIREETPFSKYMVWRKSAAVVAILPCLISACLEYASMARFFQLGGMSAGEKVTIVFPRLDSSVLLVLSIYSVANWQVFSSLTLQGLRITWALSVILPLFPPVFFGNESSWLWYAIQVIPLTITLPYCVNRASLRTCVLVPESHVALGLLFLFLPIYSLLILLSILPVHNYYGGPGLVTAGMILLSLSPWIYLLNKSLYLRPPEEDKAEDDQLSRVESYVGIMNFAGILLIVVWSLMTRPSSGLDTMQLIFEGIGRVFITNVMACDALIQVSATIWRCSDSMEGGDFESLGRADTVFAPICEAIGSKEPDKPSSKKDVDKTTDHSKELDRSDKPSKSDVDDDVEIGMHDVFRDGVTDIKDFEAEAMKAPAPKETKEKEAEHEVFDMDLETGDDDDRSGDKRRDDDDDIAIDDVLKLMRALSDVTEEEHLDE